MNSSKSTHLAVIGAGPGGYAAAFLAADLGLETTLIDTEANPGGVCLYRGCIPSKALLHVAKILSETREAKNFGIDFGTPKIDINKTRNWKEDMVNKMTANLGLLCKSRKVQFIQGRANFLNNKNLEIQKENGDRETLSFNFAVIATGSRPTIIPDLPSSPRILNSTGALELKDVPKSLLVVGGGYIGLELGIVYAQLGSKVSVVEMLSGLLLSVDRDLADILIRRVDKLFESIMVNTKVISMKETKNAISVQFDGPEVKNKEREFEKVLVAVGRKPNSGGLGLENTKVQVNERGFIKVDLQRRTTEPNILAIGDVAGDPMLAHKASHEGRVAVEAIAGKKTAFEPKAIPAVVFTDPEIAWCGLTETEAQKQNRPVKITKFPWGASGRAMTLDRSDGLTKLILDPDSERLLGVGIVGSGAGELIAEGVLAIEMGAVASDLKLSIHPHPTLSETLMESAEAFFGQSTHIYNPKR